MKDKKNRSENILWLFIRHLEHKNQDPRLHWRINQENDDEETTKWIIIISFQLQQRRTNKKKSEPMMENEETTDGVKWNKKKDWTKSGK